MSSAPKPRPVPQARPKYYDVNLAHLPPPGLVSIFHRVSGALLFFPLIPALLYVMQGSLGSEAGYEHLREVFSRPSVKLVSLVFVWAYAHHFFAGIRFLLLDLHWGIARDASRASAVIVLVLGVLTTVLVGWRLW